MKVFERIFKESECKKFDSLIIFSRKKALSTLLASLLVCNYSIQAEGKMVDHPHTALETLDNNKKDEWIQFPYTIQISTQRGITQKISQLLAPDDTQVERQHLNAKGISVDVGVLQIRRFVYKHFHSYPKLGLVFNYNWLENNGSLTGGSIYLEPQHDYLDKWEVFPRLGLGIIYADIPGTNFRTLSNNKEDDSKSLPDTQSTQNIYRQGLHWDLSLALVARINLTPHWQFSPSIGFRYLPILGEEHDKSQGALEDIPLNNFTAGVAIGYIPNPSLISYSGEVHKKGSRINIGWLSAFKELNASSLGLHAQNLPSYPTDDEGKYYYVGGIYGQWSFQVNNNHALTLATEWVIDGVTKQVYKDMVSSSPLKISMLGGHEFRWGKLLFGQQLGLYIMNSEGIQASLEGFYFYTRLGLDYKITDFLAIGASLKTNVLLSLTQEDRIKVGTDFIDFRISYLF